MRKTFIYILSWVVCSSLYGQVISVSDFAIIATLSDKKAENYITKRGFTHTARNYDEGKVVNEYFYGPKKKGKEKAQEPADSVLRFIAEYSQGKNTGVIYKTTSLTEYETLIQQFTQTGYISGREEKDSALFFQKADIVVHVGEVVQEEGKFYQVQVEKTSLPALSSIRYAEDLLQYRSHENLVMMFGAANVKKDVYYFTDKDVARCSVLYPNTKSQVIFIWEDEENSRYISYLMIGGSLRAESSAAFNQTISLNVWHSAAGLHTGMKISELLRINESDFSFYGTGSEFAFMAVPEKKGNIDFKKTGIVLGCLNCNGVSLLKKEKVSVEEAVNAGLQLYILSIVLMPD